MVIWPEFNKELYRDDDHRENALHFIYLSIKLARCCRHLWLLSYDCNISSLNEKLNLNFDETHAFHLNQLALKISYFFEVEIFLSHGSFIIWLYSFDLGDKVPSRRFLCCCALNSMVDATDESSGPVPVVRSSFCFDPANLPTKLSRRSRLWDRKFFFLFEPFFSRFITSYL